jgi:Leucine-rich repeat (LRR) protein
MYIKLLTFIFVLTLSSFKQSQKTNKEAKLDLSNHNLKAIPDSVLKKTNLTYLDLGNGATYYPTGTVLFDDNPNRISELPENIGDLVNLKILLLNANRLTILPNSITKLSKLEVLDLSLNTDLNVIKELDKIEKLTNLRVLKIVYTQIDSNNLELVKSLLPNVKIIFSVNEYLKTLK